MKTKIWILNHYALPPNLPGGTRHFDLGSELTRRGHDISIFASSFHYQLFRDIKLRRNEKWKCERINGLRFYWVRTFPYFGNTWKRVVNMMSFMINVYLFARILHRKKTPIGKPDLIIGSSVHLLAVVAGFFLAKKYKVPFVMEVRDLWPQTLIDMGVIKNNSLVTQALRLLEKFLYQRADKIIYVPPLAGSYFDKIGIQRSKTVWLPNGVNVNKFKNVSSRCLRKNRFVVMYAGAIGRTNGLDVLLDAAARLKNDRILDILIILVGDGPEKSRLQMEKKQKNLENIMFFPPVSKSEIPSILAGADVLIHVEQDIPNLSRFGSTPNKLFDYLASGRPLIISSSFVKDRLDKAGCGIHVPPDSPDKIAEAILQLYRLSPEERKKWGKRAVIYVKNNYDYSVLADRFETEILARI